MATCVAIGGHFLVSDKFFSDTGLLLTLSEGAYRYGRYDKCIQWSEMLFANTQDDFEKVTAKALSGKLHFHIYRRKQQVFQEVLPEKAKGISPSK